ncbi:MAG: hypothetical protein LBV72_19460 [Tannerella sp.]|jgi:hypothetical protein|nr:hypothetical protein [Tannerella sp.]
MRFIEDMSPNERKKYFENRRIQIEKQQEQQAINDTAEEARYRCEQTVIIRSNGVVVSHADTKREFTVKKYTTAGNTHIQVCMVDNIINIKPETIKDAAQLLIDLDNVKSSNVLVSLDNSTGMIYKILNHKDIVLKWGEFKNSLFDKYKFIRAEANRQKLHDFVDMAENMIKSHDLLLQDLKTKLFFDLFFDKYLITKQDLFQPYSRVFYSQLFEGVKIIMNFTQEVLRESPDMFMVKKHSVIDKKKLDLYRIIEMYDNKFKPQIKYGFSEYDYKVIENTVYSTGKNYWIEQSDVSILERVKNNIDVLTDYKLKKIEL